MRSLRKEAASRGHRRGWLCETEKRGGAPVVFSSLTFLFLYLPLTLLVYFLSPLRWRNFVLLVVSLLFYGWGEPVYIVIMFLSIIIDYTHGLLVEKFRSDDKRPGGSWPSR